MKSKSTKPCLLITLLLATLAGFSQNGGNNIVTSSDNGRAKHTKKVKNHEIKYIVFDYQNDADKSYTSTEDFENSVGIKIININKKLFDINKDITSTSFNTAVPDAFKIFGAATVPSTNTADKPTTQNLANPVTGILFAEEDIAQVRDSLRGKVQACQQLYKSISDKINLLDIKSTAFLANYKHIKNFLSYENDIINLGKQCRLTFTAIQQKLSEITKARLTDDLTELDDVLNPLAVTTANEGDLVKNRAIIESYLKQVVIKNEKLNTEVSLAYGESNMNQIKQDIAAFGKLAVSLSNSLKKLKGRTKQEDNIFIAVSDVRLLGTLENSLLLTSDFYKILDVPTLNKNIVTFGTSGINELLGYYDAFNESNYTFYVAPQELNSDLTTYTINITPKDNSPCQIDPKSYKVKIRAKTGVKIDFSTGLFANIGGNNFLDQSYRFEDMPGDTTLQVLRNKNKNFMYPTLGALMHIYKRNGTDFQPSLCFGVSTKDISKVNFHFGGSLIMGYSQRFIVNGGVTLGKSTLLQDKYTENQIIKKTGAPDVVPTSDFNRFGFFFAFTYNLAAK